MHELQTQILTYSMNATLLSKTKCQKMLQHSLKCVLSKNLIATRNSYFYINNVEAYEIKSFRGRFSQNLKIAYQLNELQQNELKNHLNQQLAFEQIKLGIIPLLTINKLSIKNEKVKKSGVYVSLLLEVNYRQEWLV